MLRYTRATWSDNARVAYADLEIYRKVTERRVSGAQESLDTGSSTNSVLGDSNFQILRQYEPSGISMTGHNPHYALMFLHNGNITPESAEIPCQAAQIRP